MRSPTAHTPSTPVRHHSSTTTKPRSSTFTPVPSRPSESDSGRRPIDTTTVSLTASPSVAEGGQITYTASLTSAAQSPVTVTLSNGAVINIAAGASSGMVSVSAPGDDVYVDAGNVSATISSATGGGFEQLAINPAAASTAITDTTDITTVSLSASASVAEDEVLGLASVALDAMIGRYGAQG